MKLASVQVENYRSIVKTQSLKLDEHLTVILGPNNEGKSNLLKAVVLAMECLRFFKIQAIGNRNSDNFALRVPGRVYDWESDFPRAMQKKYPSGQTILTLIFELTQDERASFKKICGNAINGDLPIEIKLGSQGAKFKVKKPGRGAKAYKENSIKVAYFISNAFNFEYIPAIRPGELSLEVVGSLLERELESLNENPQYLAALKQIDEIQKPIYESLEKSVQEQLKKLLPSVKKVKISQGTALRSRFRSPQLIIDDGTATALEAKGDGIKSLAAISLMRASNAGGKAKSLMVAIEEPESHLHPGAIRQLATIVQEMATEHQVIITTHSPLLIARNKMQANIIVSKSKAMPAKNVKALRDSLGVQVEDSLTTAEFVILVEGKTDIEALTSLFQHLSPQFSQFYADGRVVFDDLNGVGNIGFKLSTLSQSITTQIFISDDDKAGRGADKKAEESGLANKYRFTWKRPADAFRDTEIEDLIDPSIYWGALQRTFGVTLDVNAFNNRPENWTQRMKLVYEAGGKRWSSSVENEMKKNIANIVSNDPSVALLAQNVPLVKNVVNAITDLIGN